MGTEGTAFAQGSHFAYSYDELRQVTDAERFEGTDFANPGPAILPRTFGYQYDDIGNRLTSRLGQPGSPLAQTDYTTNALNQYSAISYLPSSNSNLRTHDPDGNLLQQGDWEYIWNGENRLVETVPSVSSGEPRLTFAYDAEGRRVQKTVYEWTGLMWLPQRTHTFVWSGWDMLATYGLSPSTGSGQTLPLASVNVWGLDLVGSQDVTGNVGALLAIETDSVQGVHFYDANGNVGQIVDVATGNMIAHYEYSPFGEVIASSGTFAAQNRIRFSTKYQDEQTGWLYYGFRYYDPETGRWASRDPIGEQGGLNIYGFVGNDGVNWVDVLGLCTPEQLRCRNIYDKIVEAELKAFLARNSYEINKAGYKSTLEEYIDEFGYRGDAELNAMMDGASEGLLDVLEQIAPAGGIAEKTADYADGAMKVKEAVGIQQHVSGGEYGEALRKLAVEVASEIPFLKKAHAAGSTIIGGAASMAEANNSREAMKRLNEHYRIGMQKAESDLRSAEGDIKREGGMFRIFGCWEILLCYGFCTN